MSNLMEELMAELNRVNELKNEVNRTVAMHNAEIKASRDEKAKQIANSLIDLGWKLDKLKDKGYYPDIPLDVDDHNGHPLFINYSFNDVDGKTQMSVYGGWQHCINYRININGIRPNTTDIDNAKITNALIDGWDKECEQKLEYRIAKIMKETIARQMEAAKAKLEKSNDEYEKYFKKGE